MRLNDYQAAARLTAVYPGRFSELGINYCVSLLCEEAGEVAGRWAKFLRNMPADTSLNQHTQTLSREERARMIEELGDTLWALASLALELGCDLDALASMNLCKLADRQASGTLKGDRR